MAIPDFQSIMRPMLTILADDQDHTVKEIRERMASNFSLQQLEVMLPSGRAKLVANRVGWAITHLYRGSSVSMMYPDCSDRQLVLDVSVAPSICRSSADPTSQADGT